jgi:hypothetical protein
MWSLLEQAWEIIFHHRLESVYPMFSRKMKLHLENGKPKIVCLCGSTRFYKEFQDANRNETLQGNIVLSVGCFVHAANGEEGGGFLEITDEQKEALDTLHFRKIELADEVLVLNVGGYIGKSTQREIGYASRLDKPIRYLEP